jgi:hypothetical protein
MGAMKVIVDVTFLKQAYLPWRAEKNHENLT